MNTASSTRPLARHLLAGIAGLAMAGAGLINPLTAHADPVGHATAASIRVATPAAARDGVCDSGEFCYYFNSNEQGAVSDFTQSVSDYGTTEPTCYDFKGSGGGSGTCIKNQAASAWNRSTKTVRVYYDSDFEGTHLDVAPGAKINLGALKNQNASHAFVGAATGTGIPCHTDGTNTTMPTFINVYMTSQNRVVSMPFKDYVRNVLPNEWVSGWNSQSLQAGAMAVKTFGWYFALHSTNKTSNGVCFDVFDTVSSQRYIPGSTTAATDAAVNATWNERMSRNSAIFQSHYCSTTTACGSSWVNGDWMSQYGSQSLAVQGWDYKRILRNYYTGITINP